MMLKAGAKSEMINDPETGIKSVPGWRMIPMKNRLVILWAILLPIAVIAQGSIQFDDYFLDRTLRVDYFHIGNASKESIVFDQMKTQPVWAGNPDRLIDRFGYGKTAVRVYDVASNRLIFSNTWSTIFSEYQTTDPAIEGIEKAYHESACIPFPKKPVLFVMESRDKKNLFHPVFQMTIDPGSIQINHETADPGIRVYRVMDGDPHYRVDLAWVAEGYREDQFDQFKKDVDRYVGIFFSAEPYKSNRGAFNIYGVFKASPESGVDEPERTVFRNTALNASFNALNLDRYLLTDDNRTLRDIAMAVPYDALVIMVNSDRYGGGGIYNLYSMSTVNNSLSDKVFMHEFGHSFAGLGDEYYSSSVAYNEFYPKGIEPVDPNLTALLDPERLKWRDLVSPGLDIPTPWGKEEREALEEENNGLRMKMHEELEKLRSKDASKSTLEKTEKRYRNEIEKNRKKMAEIRTSFAFLKGRVGAFEGAGYTSRGLYRPELECLMFSNSDFQFCAVCRQAIENMILFYTGKP